jgi:ABC-type Zn uptake system ZnuABC Zn-binding protein ZnuA
MIKDFNIIVSFIGIVSFILAGCQSAQPGQSVEPGSLRVIATATFLADIAQQVAGDRLVIDSLVPVNVDPHTFQPTPRDIARIADSQVLIVNGAGFEEWLEEALQNAGGERLVITASAGLEMRASEQDLHDDDLDADEPDDHGHEGDADSDAPNDHGHEGDPHFWLNPLHAIHYAENIREGLIQVDPGGAVIYRANASQYIEQLHELDTWIQAQVAQIPLERRLLVTNHESFGYFADRYGFQIVGTIIPSISTGAAPSAQELARLVDEIREAGVIAIFLETGANPQLAQQLGQETGVQVIADLYTHSVASTDGSAPDYIAMMKYNTTKIVEALK